MFIYFHPPPDRRVVIAIHYTGGSMVAFRRCAVAADPQMRAESSGVVHDVYPEPAESGRRGHRGGADRAAVSTGRGG